MELRLFLVMTLIGVNASAQLHEESSTMAELKSTNTHQQNTTSTLEIHTGTNTTEYRTTEATSNVNTSNTPQETTVKETIPVPTKKSPAVGRMTEESTPAYVTATRKQFTETSPDVIASTNGETTTLKSNEINPSTKLSTERTKEQEAETSATTSFEKQQTGTTLLPKQETTKAEEMASTRADVTEKATKSTESSGEKTSTDLSPNEFFKWLDSIEPNNTKANVTEKEETDSKIETNDKPNEANNVFHDHHDHHHKIDPDRMPPKEFFQWLDSIHPDSNVTTVKNIIDTSIISTEKLIIVVSTICGTFVLFVAILIAISCCRRKKNLRNDSEKSDFSMNSVISIPEKRNSRSSDIFSPDKNGFNNVFMGIPANNEVWKKLDQLSPTASAVMPESTKM